MTTTIIVLALQLIIAHEGLVLHTYADPVGLLTIGYGHTSAANPQRLQVRPGMRITKEQALAIAAQDAAEAFECFGSSVEVAYTSGEATAYTDFIFNIGCKKFKHSGLLRELNRGHHATACRALLQWTRCGDRVCPGLVKRRRAEYKLCMSEVLP